MPELQRLLKTTVFLTRSLNRGGAERQLVVLAKGMVRRGHSVTVAVFYGRGAYGDELAAAGVRVVDLKKGGRWDILPFMVRLVRFMRHEQPVILHGYLDMPNILSSLLKPLLPGTRIVWGVRASNLDLSQYDWLLRFSYAMERRFARFADCIIANSQAGKEYAVKNGFPEQKMLVVPNGIDTEYFRFCPDGRKKLRAEWGISEDQVLVGIAARFDPMKDHLTFLKAAAQVAKEFSSARFICIGGGPTDYVARLKQHAVELGLTANLLWLGTRGDMPAIFSALDLACSTSSCGEGFSNSVAEAMACSLPCIVTDVGDSAFIVGDFGRIVAPGNVISLTVAIEELVRMRPCERGVLGEAARARVVSEFHMDLLIQRTETALKLR